MLMTNENIRYCGWDIGGAHLKLAGLSENGELQCVEQVACPLWLGLEHLELAINQLSAQKGLAAATHGFTMTGELCDSFGDRVNGVNQIVACLASLFDPQNILVFGLNDSWYSLDDTKGAEFGIASANWYATASYCAKRVNQGVVIDIGSTTSDLVPLANGHVVARGKDDFSRLQQLELVYTGVARTAIASIVETLPFRNELIPIVAEYFANSADVYRILECLPQNADLYDTADGRDKSIASSAARLFRMICRDYAGELDEAKQMAKAVSEAQLERLSLALMHQMTEHGLSTAKTTVVGLGCGAMLTEDLARRCGLDFVLFNELVPEVSVSEAGCVGPNVCGPAVAVAYALAERQT